ncbi:hypothetical protein [Deinococcus sp. UYEF24]
MTTKLKLIAAALTASVAVLGVTQIASAQNAPTKALPNVSSTLAQAQPADIAEAGDTPDVAGTAETADVPEAGDVADAAEPSGGAGTDQVQDGDQGGPETPDAPGANSK